MSDPALTGGMLLVLLAVVGTGELLRARAGWRAEDSRRVVHVLTGLAVVVAVPLFESPVGLYVLAGSFVVANLTAVAKGWLPGMHGIRRRSIGTATFPLALVFALLTCWTLDPGRVYIIQIAFLVLALSDPLASLAGTRLRRPRRFLVGRHEKSVAGSASFFASAWLLITAGWVTVGPGDSLPQAVMAGFAVAALAAAAEALFTRGWDNLFVVVAVIAPLAWLDQFPGEVGSHLMAAGVAVVFGAVSLRLRFLATDGALAAAALAYFVVAFGGWAWVAPGFAFFFLSSALSKAGARRKRAGIDLTDKGHVRDAGQVFSNGGVAWLLVLAHVFFPGTSVLYWGFVGAFAAAAADTWGTEVGTLVRGRTRLMWGWKPVPTGASGGVSLAGSLGALAGAVVVFASAVPFATDFLPEAGTAWMAAVVIGAGIVAAMADSLLGATVQAVYVDHESGRLTERPVGERVRGWRWLTNDRVNLVCTLIGALIPILALTL